MRPSHAAARQALRWSAPLLGSLALHAAALSPAAFRHASPEVAAGESHHFDVSASGGAAETVSGEKAPAHPAAGKAALREATPGATPGTSLGTPPPASAAADFGGTAEQSRYLSAVRARIQEQLKLPASLARLGLRGEARLQLTLSSSGELRAVEVVRSSGDPRLDQIAADAARRATPFGPAPAAASDGIVFQLPVLFQ
jgi:TonB family protein